MTQEKLIATAEHYEKEAEELRALGDMAAAKAFAQIAQSFREEAATLEAGRKENGE